MSDFSHVLDSSRGVVALKVGIVIASKGGIVALKVGIVIALDP